MDFVLYSRITEADGIAIADDLHLQGGKEPPDSRIRVLIRYGNSYSHLRYQPEIVVNKRDALVNAINKERAIQIFQRNRISVPSFSNAVPCVGRSRFHTQGQNFWLCWERGQVETAQQEGAEYFIKYIPIKQEWRVHVIEGQVSFVQKKYQQDRVSTSFMGVQGVRDAWHKQVLQPNVAGDEVCNLAVRAVESLGLDFGGVDIIVSLDNNKLYLLEVNTGPALPTSVVRSAYLAYFRRILRETR